MYSSAASFHTAEKYVGFRAKENKQERCVVQLNNKIVLKDTKVIWFVKKKKMKFVSNEKKKKVLSGLFI